MAELTKEKAVAYNEKVKKAKEKAAEDTARKELAEKELKRICGELTEKLGRPITPETLAEEHEAFVEEATKTIASGEKILAGLEQEVKETEDAADAKRSAAIDSAAMVAPEKATAAPALDVKPKATSSGSGVDVTDLDDLLGL